MVRGGSRSRTRHGLFSIIHIYLHPYARIGRGSNAERPLPTPFAVLEVPRRVRASPRSWGLPASRARSPPRSEERRVGKECRYWCDWSSDVCSSDLWCVGVPVPGRVMGSLVLSIFISTRTPGSAAAPTQSVLCLPPSRYLKYREGSAHRLDLGVCPRLELDRPRDRKSVV